MIQNFYIKLYIQLYIQKTFKLFFGTNSRIMLSVVTLISVVVNFVLPYWIPNRHPIRYSGMNRWIRYLPLFSTQWAWVEYEPTTGEFTSNALIEWVIRLWFQLVLWANITRLLRFQLLFNIEIWIWPLLSAVATLSNNWNLAQVTAE